MDTVNGQLLVVLAVVALAAGYLLRSAWQTWNGKKSACSSGCGKCVSELPATADSARRIPLN